MPFPLEDDLLAERAAVVATLRSMTDDEFEHGTTLCSEWAPRDVLAHLIGGDTGLLTYARHLPDIAAGNAALVDAARAQSRERLLARADHWARRLPPHVRISAWFWLQDTTVHHQDLLRPLGRIREIPASGRAALLREGFLLGGRKLLHYRIEPTDTDLGAIGRPRGWAAGAGHTVQGPAEALALWLTGRDSVADELEFG